MNRIAPTPDLYDDVFAESEEVDAPKAGVSQRKAPRSFPFLTTAAILLMTLATACGVNKTVNTPRQSGTPRPAPTAGRNLSPVEAYQNALRSTERKLKVIFSKLENKVVRIKYILSQLDLAAPCQERDDFRRQTIGILKNLVKALKNLVAQIPPYLNNGPYNSLLSEVEGLLATYSARWGIS